MLILLLTVIILIILIAIWSENNEYGAADAALGVEWSQLYISTHTVIVTILVYSNHHHHFQQQSPLSISIHIVTDIQKHANCAKQLVLVFGASADFRQIYTNFLLFINISSVSSFNLGTLARQALMFTRKSPHSAPSQNTLTKDETKSVLNHNDHSYHIRSFTNAPKKDETNPGLNSDYHKTIASRYSITHPS